ncbi:MAG: PKD domain-containing protein, partial [Bacteroidia bacterium]
NSTGANQYDWDFGDNYPHSTADNPYYWYYAPGTYTVVLTARDSLCSDTASAIITILAPNAVANLSNTQTVSISGIPDGALIQFNLAQLQRASIRVYATNGQLLEEQQSEVQYEPVSIDLRGKAQGIYVIEVIIGDQRHTSRIFKD